MTRSTSRRSVLFVLWNGGGNVPPSLGIGARLVTAGHRVCVLGSPSLRPVVERAGLAFTPFVHGPDHDPTEARSRTTGGEAVGGIARAAREGLFFGPAPAIARDTAEAIGRFAPDLVAADYVTPGAMVAAEAAGLPVAVLVPHIYPFVHRGTPRRGPFSYLFERTISGGLDALNRVRREYGLRALSAAREQYLSAERILLTTYKAFDPPDVGILATTRYVGPQLPLPSRLAARDRNAIEPPLVVVSFSTAWQDQDRVARALLGECSRLPVRVVFLTGPAMDPQTFKVAANISVREFVPHREILPGAAAVVCHGGHGTVMGALGHGLPLLCLPFEQDQFDIANLVARLGAGIHLARTSPPAAMRDALETLLDEPSFTTAAAGVREQFLIEHDPERAVCEIESACAGHAGAMLP